MLINLDEYLNANLRAKMKAAINAGVDKAAADLFDKEIRPKLEEQLRRHTKEIVEIALDIAGGVAIQVSRKLYKEMAELAPGTRPDSSGGPPSRLSSSKRKGESNDGK